MSNPPLVVLFDPDSLAADEYASAIERGGYRTARVADPASARAAIDGDQPAALVIVEGPAGPAHDALARAARGRGIPVLGLIGDSGGGDLRPERRREYDRWARRPCTPGELSEQLGSTLAARALVARAAPPINAHLLQMIVHDLRNPLNVIGLTLRVIEQLPAREREPIQEDLTFLRDNALQIERMLSLVGDFCRLGEMSGPADPFPFDPGRLLDDLLAERAAKAQERAYPARLDVDPTTPGEVNLDPTRVRLALQCALANAAGAADRPLAVRSWGEGGRWRVALTLDRPPPPTVRSQEVDPDRYERLSGSNTSREAMDLAIAAWLARQVGGTVRLEVTPGQSTSILLDWPADARPA